MEKSLVFFLWNLNVLLSANLHVVAFFFVYLSNGSIISVLPLSYCSFYYGKTQKYWIYFCLTCV